MSYEGFIYLLPSPLLHLQTPNDMGHLVQINSWKTHRQKELLVCSVTAAYLLLPQTAEEAQIDCRANTGLLYISGSHKMT